MEPITPEQLTNLCQEALAEVVEEVIEQPATFHLLEYKLSNGCREGVLDKEEEKRKIYYVLNVLQFK